MTTYLFHTSLLLSGFTIFYWLILRHETYFRLNRWVILSAVLFSLALPLLQIPASMSLWSNTSVPAESIIETISNAPSQIIGNSKDSQVDLTLPQGEVSKDSTVQVNNYSLTEVLSALYIVGLVIFFIVFLIQVVVLLAQRYNLNSYKTGAYTIVELVKDAEPCSFMNYIFINPTKYDEETYEHIIEHEKAHIDQSHFIDKIIAELLVVIFWFNPFTWLLRKSIGQNLEFLTDKSLLDQGIQKDKYQMSLLKVSVSNKPLNLTASYNSSFLKSRISMMNSKNSSVVAAWKYLFIVPLFVLSIASLNAINDKDISGTSVVMNEINNSNQIEEKYIVNTFGNDHISKTINIEDISKIALGMSGNLIISQGEEQKITITGPQDLVNQLDTNAVAGNWTVQYRTPGPRKMSKQVNVYAQLTNLSHLALSGTGSIKSINRFKNLQELFVALSGSGSIEFAGDATFVDVALAGGGNIHIDSNSDKVFTALSGNGNISLLGTTKETRFIGSGSGNIAASGLVSNKSVVLCDGESLVSLFAKDSLDITAAGNSIVNYIGNPNLVKDLKNEAKIARLK